MTIRIPQRVRIPHLRLDSSCNHIGSRHHHCRLSGQPQGDAGQHRPAVAAALLHDAGPGLPCARNGGVARSAVDHDHLGDALGAHRRNARPDRGLSSRQGMMAETVVRDGGAGDAARQVGAPAVGSSLMIIPTRSLARDTRRQASALQVAMPQAPIHHSGVCLQPWRSHRWRVQPSGAARAYRGRSRVFPGRSQIRPQLRRAFCHRYEPHAFVLYNRHASHPVL
jgi:hypothetical protein